MRRVAKTNKGTNSIKDKNTKITTILVLLCTSLEANPLISCITLSVFARRRLMAVGGVCRPRLDRDPI